MGYKFVGAAEKLAESRTVSLECNIYIRRKVNYVATDSKMKFAIMFILLGCTFLAIAERTPTISDNDSLSWSASSMWQNIQDAVFAGVETIREKLSRSGIIDDAEAKVLRALEKVKENVETARNKLAESGVVKKVNEGVQKAQERVSQSIETAQTEVTTAQETVMES